ncbi:MAG: cytochrome c [Mariprofundaceae bacterium]|nr:cytochrome c [Mariprofundaceae bacterium]
MPLQAAEAEKTATTKVLVGDAKHGEKIFNSICIHCHRTDHEASAVGAPGLRDVLDRHDEAWLFQWIAGPAEFSKKDETAKALTESNPYGLVMPTLPEMADPQNRYDVIEFLKTLKEK